MSIRIDEVELGKTYKAQNGATRRVIEIIPDRASRKDDDISNRDVIRYEAEHWGYDKTRHNGHTRVKIKVREKQNRQDFAKDSVKRLD